MNPSSVTSVAPPTLSGITERWMSSLLPEGKQTRSYTKKCWNAGDHQRVSVAHASSAGEFSGAEADCGGDAAAY
ncbi:MAG TPA: hypothetical protein VMO76_02005 [Candidatus Udaeobacter sp.]|nr:hypothetical protein [Candidatus Udaeobacter sp.]